MTIDDQAGGSGADSGGLPDGPVPGDDLGPAAVAARTEQTEAAGRRPCVHCGRPIPLRARSDARYCSPGHRTDHYKARERRASQDAAAAGTLRAEIDALAPLVTALAQHTGALQARLADEVANALAREATATAAAEQARRDTEAAEERAKLAAGRAAQARQDADRAALDRDARVAEAEERLRHQRALADAAREQSGRDQQARATAEQNEAAARHLLKIAEQNAAAAHDQLTTAHQQLRDAHAEIDRLHQDLARLTRERDTARADLADQRDRTIAAAERAAHADAAREQTEHELAQVRGRLAEAETERQTALTQAAAATARADALETRVDRAEERADAAARRAEQDARRADEATTRADRAVARADQAAEVIEELRAALAAPRTQAGEQPAARRPTAADAAGPVATADEEKGR